MNIENKPNTTPNKTNLVLSGGGIKGIVMLGALKALQDKKYLDNITSISATSVGGIIGSLYVIGYDIDELFDFLDLFDISKMKSINPSRFLTHFGLDDGKKFTMVIQKLFESKQISTNITFLELFNKTGIKLIMTGVCLNDKKVHYFSHLTYPNMPVLIAIRITMSVPFLFVPVEYDNKMYIDGGCMDNYPIFVYDDELESTIGIHLCDIFHHADKIDNLESYMSHLIQCLFEGCNIKADYGYEKYTIRIKVGDATLLNLKLDSIEKKKLFDFGYDEVLKSKIIISESLNV